MFSNKYYIIVLLALICSVTACVDQDFDEPPGEALDFELPSNIIAIAEVKAKHIEGEFERLQEDAAIRAVVIADDESGNFFKTLVLQDESGGIELKVNKSGLHNEFPIGREVYVLLKDLYLGDYRGVTQLGGALFTDSDGSRNLGGIEDVFVDQHIFKGEKDKVISPTVVEIEDLNSSHIHTLIQLDAVQFFVDDAGAPYADVVNKFAANLRVEECDADLITLRSSGYADFADEPAPDGNGTIIGVYSVFGNTRQMFIRNLDDVLLTGERCDVDDTGGEDDPTDLLSIADLRADFLNGTTAGTDNTRIEGIVISDVFAENITNRNLVLQDGNSGIIVRFDEAHEFELGDKVKVNISGLEISEFNGSLQINNAPLQNAFKISNLNSVAPTVLTIAELLADVETYESTLVKIEGATISSTTSTSYSGNASLSDATGTISLFTTSYSSFASSNFPTNVVNVTAIVGQATAEQTPQLNIRNLRDVEGGELGEVDPFKVDFQNQIDFEDANVEGWQNISLKGTGTRTWLARGFQGNLFIQASAFQDEQPEMDAWFISPEIDFSTQTSLSFESGIAFWQHDGLSLLISTDFDGSDVAAATWEILDGATLAGENDENYAWIGSGTVSLAAYSGKGYIAFRHLGDSATNTTSSRIDNIVIE